MSSSDASDPQVQAVIVKIQSDLERLDQNVSPMAETLEAEASPTILVHARANLLCQFYTGLESVFEKGLKMVDAMPGKTTPNHHQEILKAAATAIIFAPSSEPLIRDLCLYRHGYGSLLRIPETKDKTEKVVATWATIKNEVSAFIARNKQ